MALQLFDAAGYLDIRAILATGSPFIFIVGGRGIGKTYGALKTAVEDKRFFMYMRRTQAQVDIVNKSEFNPFNSINRDEGLDIRPRPFTKYNSVFEAHEPDPASGEDMAEPVGYTCALSTISNLRSFDASAVDLLIYDEFIADKHDRPIKYEGSAFLGAIETIGRNRELRGENPLQVLCLANAVDLANPIYLELNLVNVAMKMKEKGQQIRKDGRRGYLMINLDVTPIGQKKKDTALYRLAADDSEFSRMAISNEYSFEEIGSIKPRRLVEYVPLVRIGEICIYKHKSDRLYYVSQHASGSPDVLTAGEADRARFKKKYYYLWIAYLDGRIEFESYLAQVLFERYNK